MIAIVTGANQGIGLEVVRQLADLGHTVVLTSRNEQKGRAALDQVNNPNVHYHQLDVTDKASILRFKEYVLKQFGRLDILVNNAGINYDVWHNVLNADLDNVRDTIETNLYGPWEMIKAFAPVMEKNNYGRIVNVSSGAGAISSMPSNTPGYGVSKAALNVLTIKASGVLSDYNILVNSVCPGWVRTNMGGEAAPRSVAKGAETIVWAATLDDGSPTGRFFRDKKEIPF